MFEIMKKTIPENRDNKFNYDLNVSGIAVDKLSANCYAVSRIFIHLYNRELA